MSQLFISYSAEDKAVAVALSEALRQRGFGVWYYEPESVPGPSYLKRVSAALKQCEAVVLIISPISMDSRWVDVEVSRAFQSWKMFVPILHGVTYEEFEERRPDWALALGSATTVSLPPAGVPAIVSLLERGIKELGVTPALAPPPPAEPAEPEGAGVAPPDAETDEVECTIFGSRDHAAGDSALFQFWLHTAEQYPDVEGGAKAADPLALPLAGMILESGLARGESVSLSLKVGEFQVEPSGLEELTWRGEPDSSAFAVNIPDEGPSAQVGRARLFREGVPLASLAFKLSINAKAPPAKDVAPAPQSLVRYRTAYICYASEDRSDVLKRVQMLKQAGISISMDVLSMKPGEDWEEQVYRLIDEADVFYLFWSEAAARSPWVAREVAYVLARKEGKPDYPPEIIPIVLGTKAPPPPAWLEELHFDDPLLYFIKAESESK